MPTNKLAGLELLRFGAAFTVLLAHYNHFFIYRYAYEGYVPEQQPFYHLFRLLYGYGTRAVEVFWCLSGFIFFYKYAAVIQAKALPFRRFAVLRFSRLYPLHWATLLLVAVLQGLYWRQNGAFYVVELNDLKHFILNLFFASAWGFESGFSFNSPVWSVSVELLAYLFFFGVTYFLRADVFAVGLCLLGCWGCTYFTGHEPVVIRCIFYFYLGGLSCIAYQQVDRAHRPLMRGLALLAAAGIGALAFRRFLLTGEVTWILNLGVPVALILLAEASGWIGPRLAALFDFAGNLTYASYLLHFPIQLSIMLVVVGCRLDRRFATSPVFGASYVIGVFALAALVYRFFEMPVQRRIRERGLPRRLDGPVPSSSRI